MEKDLARVQDMMAGLTEQQAELSEAMKRFRRLSSGGGLENMLEKSEKGEFCELDNLLILFYLKGGYC